MLDQAQQPVPGNNNTQLLPQIAQQLVTLDPTQLAWISGYSWALSQQGVENANGINGVNGVAVEAAALNIAAEAAAPAVKKRILVLSCSQTGNAQAVAKKLFEQLQGINAEVSLASAGDYRSRSLVDEDIVLLVTSTQGEGEAPEEAVPLYKFIFHKKAPDLSGVSFAVLGLGDSSYPKFNQAAKDFDEQFEKLGAKRLFDRVDCDLDFNAQADQWRDDIAANLKTLIVDTPTSITANGAATDVVATTTTANAYSKTNPYTAELITKQRITTENANEVIHYEIDLGDSGITYEAGDSLGVYFLNAESMVDELIKHTKVNPADKVKLASGSEVTIKKALIEHLDITETTPQFVRAYAGYLAADGNHDLDAIVDDSTALTEYIQDRPPVFIISDHPVSLGAQQLHDLFRPLAPRMYSIASSQEEVDDEVHLTVRTVRYGKDDKDYQGAASGFLADHIEEGDDVKIFIEPNRSFRLPENGDTPIIMIGAGTGIAPFRAFVQDRQAKGEKGKNWLIFGNQRFTEDFLYQSEWIQSHQAGFLPKYDFAWSRQGDKKEYVQHKLAQRSQDVWQWLQEGAHIYLCGDANRMAKDVENTLIDIISKEGKLSVEDAEDYLDELREEKRYQRDVY